MGIEIFGTIMNAVTVILGLVFYFKSDGSMKQF